MKKGFKIILVIVLVISMIFIAIAPLKMTGKTIFKIQSQEQYPSFYLDLGSPSDNDSSNEIFLIEGPMLSERLQESSITYRNLSENAGYLVIKINTSSLDFLSDNGVPYKDTIINIGFKDTINETQCADYTVIRGSCRPFLDVKLNYGDLEYQKLNGIGGLEDYQWKNTTIFLENTPWQLIRSIDGFFEFRIAVPRNLMLSSNLSINYFNFSFVDSETFKELRENDRINRGFIRHDYIEKNTINSSDYKNNYVLYSRNYLEKIYPNTIPFSNEVLNSGDKISTFEISGNYEPLTFTIYAFENLINVEIQVSDLINEKGKIEKGNIKLEKVVFIDKRWLYAYDQYYGLNPGYLTEFENLDIKESNSQQIWLTVYVPENTLAGKYTGEVKIKGDGINESNLKIELDVFNISLIEPDATPYVYHSPYQPNKNYAVNVSTVVKNLAEHEIYPILSFYTKINTNDLSINYGNKFDEFEDLKRNNLLPKKVSATIIDNRQTLWSNICKNQDYFYNECPEFDEAYKKVLQNYSDFVKSYDSSLVVSFNDEPGINEYKRRESNYLNKLSKEIGLETWVTYYSNCEMPLNGLKLDIYDNSSIQKGSYVEYRLNANKIDLPEKINFTIYDSWPRIYTADYYRKQLYLNGEILYNESNSLVLSDGDKIELDLSNYEGEINISIRLQAQRNMGPGGGYSCTITAFPDNLSLLDYDWKVHSTATSTSGEIHKSYFLGPMAKYLDYRVHSMSYVTEGNINKTLKDGDKFAYYTTYPANQPVITNNRFLNGIYASALNVPGVWVYAYGDWGSMPYDEMDSNYYYHISDSRGLRGQSRYNLVLPSWEDEIYNNLIYESLREGIQDSKIIATLKESIQNNPGKKANEAEIYLNDLYSNLNKDIREKYYHTNSTHQDYLNFENENYAPEKYADRSDNILRDLSGSEDNYDFFDEMRLKMINYIIELKSQEENPNLKTSSGSGDTSSTISETYSEKSETKGESNESKEVSQTNLSFNEEIPEKVVASSNSLTKKIIYSIIPLIILSSVIVVFTLKHKTKISNEEVLIKKAKIRALEFKNRGFTREETKLAFKKAGWSEEILESKILWEDNGIN